MRRSLRALVDLGLILAVLAGLAAVVSALVGLGWLAYYLTDNRAVGASVPTGLLAYLIAYAHADDSN